ncbi:ATP-binding protein [Mycoplasmopsis gallinacea]|uniref:HTH domain-containing protein n=1 Tax=Mycoplasmopsis gallinacea TaxID=29556 RepID=A0A6H0V2V7_9BACT|nr:ATP-binding protein [Mycoplasmopsis gallinacea]QIW62064.1 HTH domain-containing protein [Mycoplasmopsis gallinacea]
MENKNIEFKIDIPEKHNKLKAEMVSFLNSNDGEIYLGVDDNGVPNLNLIKEKSKFWEEIISNWITNAFNENVKDFVEIISDDSSFKIKILEGNNKPYYYKEGEGFNSKGIYIRVGSTKRRAELEEVKKMLFNRKPNNFESTLINNDKLTFKYLENKFEEKGLKFNPIALSLINKDNKYNNAALLFSDQNPTISKFAVFADSKVSVFLDKKEFAGSIVKQLDDMIYFSNLLNRKKITINGNPERNEYLDIPEVALREAIVNCFCHRDYSLTGDIKIEFFDDKVKIFSPGGLPDNLTLEDIKEGFTAKRNKIIVNVLDKIGLIENYATGVRKIFEGYEGFEKQPTYYISENGISLTLFNRNYDESQKKPNNINDLEELKKLERSEKIIFLMKENPRITIDEMAEILEVSPRTIRREIYILRLKDKIEYIRSGKTGYWVINENMDKEE